MVPQHPRATALSFFVGAGKLRPVFSARYRFACFFLVSFSAPGWLCFFHLSHHVPTGTPLGRVLLQAFVISNSFFLFRIIARDHFFLQFFFLYMCLLL